MHNNIIYGYTTAEDGNMDYRTEDGEDRVKKYIKDKNIAKNIAMSWLGKNTNIIHNLSTISPKCFTRGDGIITREKNTALTTIGADCPSIILADKSGERGIGIAHSGYRETAKNIAFMVVEGMRGVLNIPVNELDVYITPGISVDNFELPKDEVEKQFSNLEKNHTKEHVNDPQKCMLDVQAIILTQLKLAGIPYKNIEVDRRCTYADENLYSFRRATHLQDERGKGDRILNYVAMKK